MQTFLKQCRWGQFLLLKGDLISQNVDMYGEWAEVELDLFRFLLPVDGCCIEVGSNIGMHTIPLSKICNSGRIYSFEPQRPIFHILCSNIALNNRLNVIAKNLAIGACPGKIEIEISDYSQAWNYGSFSLSSGFSSEADFKGVIKKGRIDVLSIDTDEDVDRETSINMIKIDVEGLELDVLQGARKTIQRSLPDIFVEVNTLQSIASIVHELRQYGYKGYWFFSARYRSGNFNMMPYAVSGYDRNIIFLPEFKTSLDGKLKPVTGIDDVEIPVLTNFL